ncbi:hypothetical protein Tco_0932208 [Tanacetum coccineum]
MAQNSRIKCFKNTSKALASLTKRQRSGHLNKMELWNVEIAIVTTCYTQNCSIIHRRFDKTPYELTNGRKLDISFLHIFVALCYPKNDLEDLGKLGAKGLDLTYAPSTITSQKPTKHDLDLLFEAMYDDYIGADTAPTPTNSSYQAAHIPNSSQDVDELEPQPQHAQQQGDQAPLQPETFVDNVSNAMLDRNTLVNSFANPSIDSAESSSHNVDP